MRNRNRSSKQKQQQKQKQKQQRVTRTTEDWKTELPSTDISSLPSIGKNENKEAEDLNSVKGVTAERTINLPFETQNS